MLRSDYEIVEVDREKKVVFLVDLDLGNKSVTNDAENVVLEVNSRYPDFQIVYRDSMGSWDELVHQKNEFLGFKPWRKR